MANPGVAIMAPDGVLTGFSEGITSVSVQWQNLTAFAQAEVVAACADVHTNFLLLIDNSKSSTVSFNGTYSSRLSYAKEAARLFVDSVNFGKDQVGVAYFNASGSIVQVLSDDPEVIKDAISGITATDQRTNVLDGITVGMESLDAAIGNGVLVILSDFENNEGEDPVPAANAWKQAGNVIVVVGLRVWGQFFDLAYRIASGGFFLSSYDATAEANITTLQGLKSYLCAGDCPPSLGTYPKAAINYRGFINWDVEAGQVDLHGLGSGAPDDTAAWDVLPGHGLYVDMIGKTLPDFFGATSQAEIDNGVMVSKVAYDFEGGKDYKFSIKVAGNNRSSSSGVFPVRVRIIREDDATTLLDEEITPTAWNMPFTEFEFEFTPVEDCAAKIRIEMEESTSPWNGVFIDDVVLENLTDTDIMLNDNFNSENPTTITSSYSNYGCLTVPPGAQEADPEPPTPPLEGL